MTYLPTQVPYPGRFQSTETCNPGPLQCGLKRTHSGPGASGLAGWDLHKLQLRSLLHISLWVEATRAMSSRLGIVSLCITYNF